MSDTARGAREPLTGAERSAASVGAIVLLITAVWITVNPPDRIVALANCANAAAGCLVTVDGDTTTIAAALAALAAAAALIALLGVRFTSVKAAGFELAAYEAKTAGLPSAEPQPPGADRALEPPNGARQIDSEQTTSPLSVELVAGLGSELGVVPVAVAALDVPMNEGQARFLRDYQGATRASQNGWFVTHILGPTRQQGQLFAVAIRVIPHREATERVRAARFYLGRSWGHQVFEGQQGPDGNFGITTEAYGPFLALCEIEFMSGKRIVVDHYCDFEMGSLVTA